VLTEGKEAAIAGDDVTRTALESRSQVLVIIKILADADSCLSATTSASTTLEPEPSVCSQEEPTHLAIPERSQNLIDDRRREHDLEICLRVVSRVGGRTSARDSVRLGSGNHRALAIFAVQDCPANASTGAPMYYSVR